MILDKISSFPDRGLELVVVVHTGVSVIYNYCDRFKDKTFYCHIIQFVGEKKLFYKIRLAVPLLAVVLKQIFFNGHLSNCSYWKHWAAIELHSVSPIKEESYFT